MLRSLLALSSLLSFSSLYLPFIGCFDGLFCNYSVGKSPDKAPALWSVLQLEKSELLIRQPRNAGSTVTMQVTKKKEKLIDCQTLKPQSSRLTNFVESSVPVCVCASQKSFFSFKRNSATWNCANLRCCCSNFERGRWQYAICRLNSGSCTPTPGSICCSVRVGLSSLILAGCFREWIWH